MIAFTEEFSLDPLYLRVTTVGEYAFDELFGLLDRIRDEASRAGRRRILVDSLQLMGALSEAERFQGGKRIAETFGPETKIAWLMQDQNITKLGEMAAVNRGAKLLVVSSESEALEWLLDEEDGTA